MWSCHPSASHSYATVSIPRPSLTLPLQLERSFKFMREAEDQLKAIPQFCFPDAKDWTPVQRFTRYVLVSPLPTCEA